MHTHAHIFICHWGKSLHWLLLIIFFIWIIKTFIMFKHMNKTNAQLIAGAFFIPELTSFYSPNRFIVHLPDCVFFKIKIWNNDSESFRFLKFYISKFCSLISASVKIKQLYFIVQCVSTDKFTKLTWNVYTPRRIILEVLSRMAWDHKT